VPIDIHPDERVQEMEGGEADAVVAWLARWRATRMAHHGSCPMAATSKKKGWHAGFAQRACMGGLKHEAVLVEIGVVRKRVRRKGTTATGELWLGRHCPRSRAATREGESVGRQEKGA
jgi:hypothetical protein